MVLAQDQAQASEAAAIIAEQQYQKELAQYNKDKAEYDKQKAEYDVKVKEIEDAKLKEQTRIDEEKRKEQEKADKRAAEFDKVEKQYQETLSKNPYVYRPGRAGKGYDNSQYNNYVGGAAAAKIEAEKKLRERHYTEDGYNVTTYVPERFRDKKSLSKFVEERKHMDPRLTYGNYKDAGMNTGMGKVGIARHWLLEGKLTMAEYQKIKTQGTQEWQADHDAYVARKVAKSKAKVAGQVAADQKHWANVASGNYDAKNPGDNFTDVKAAAPKEHGYAAANILKAVEVNKSGTPLTTAAEISNYITINKQTYKVPEAPTAPTIPVRTNTSTNKGTNKANLEQKQYSQDLREGKVGLAQALLNPQTTQSVSKDNTVNLQQFLAERGYDITKPETIPDSVLTTPVKYEDARKQATKSEKTGTEMGDLRKLIPSSPQVSNAVLQQRKSATSFKEPPKGGSYIGYGIDGSPIQGAPNPESVKQQYQVTTPDGKVRTFNSLEHAEKFSQRMTTTQYEVGLPTTIPTVYGAITVLEPKLFDSKEEAQSFIDNRQASLPYTQDSKILPLEQWYKGYDQFADDAYQRAKDHPDSWIYQGGAAWTSFGADMLNLATMGGDLIDKHVLNRPVIEKQPVSTIPTYYDKGFENAIQGIEVTETGVTGVTPALINPLDEGNVVSKWYQGAVKQWEKQTPAQNIGQSTVAIPMAVVDAVTAAGVVKRTIPMVTKVAAKVAATPTIVTKVIEASSISVKTIPVKPSYANYRLNTITNPDRIDLNMKGADYFEKGYHLNSPAPKSLNLQSKSFQEYVAKSISKNDATTMYGTTKDPYGNPFVKFWDKVTPKEPPKPSQYRAATQSDVRIVKGKKPQTPTYDVDPLLPREKLYKQDIPTKGADWIEPSTAPKIDLQSKSFLKDVRKQTRTIDYERYADVFVKFQKTLDPKPQRYSNIVGSIKFSKGFIPGKPTRPYKPYKPKEVQEEPYYTADGKISDILSGTVSHSPLTVRITKPDKIARIPKTGKAPTVNNEKYLEGLDFQPAKTPKGSHAPIGYIIPKPKSLPKTSTFPKMKSTKKNPDSPKPDESKPKESTGKQIQIQIQKPDTKKKSPTAPLEPVIDGIIDTPTPKLNPPNNSLVIPPVVKIQQEQKPLPIKSATIPRVIQTIKVTQTPVVKERQNIGISSTTRQTVRSVQSSRIIQSQPQKVTQIIKQKQSLRSPTSPKPKVKQAAHPIFRLKAPQRITQPEPMRPRAIAVAAVLPPPKEKKVQEKKIRKRKQKDFLGNTRTDHIVGLFKRTEIITGDKKVSKQLKKDKKYKEGVKKKRTKKKPQSLFQKQGIVKKGFKV